MDRCRLPTPRSWTRAALVLAVAFCGYLGGLPPLTGAFGVSLAEAKQFYTRKRVNGRWVNGTFPKRYARLRRSYARLDPEERVAAVPHPPIRDVASELMPAAVAVDPAATTAALGPALDAVPDGAGDERLARLRDALRARAGDLVTAALDAVAPPMSVAAVPQAPAPAPTLAPAPAVEASAPGRPTPSASHGPAADPLEPRSVSFDFQTGVKTTVFANSVVREPFDVASMKQIAVPKR